MQNCLERVMPYTNKIIFLHSRSVSVYKVESKLLHDNKRLLITAIAKDNKQYSINKNDSHRLFAKLFFNRNVHDIASRHLVRDRSLCLQI